jgi:predicted phosphate transport protein (TIGR00153 family)
VFEKFFSPNKNEQNVIKNIKKHIEILLKASYIFRDAIDRRDKGIMSEISELEREADIIRRVLIAEIYEGAFLPFLRPNIFRFVEIVDEAMNVIKNASVEYGHIYPKLDAIKDECHEIAVLNSQMIEMLLLAVDSLFYKEDLREKSLAIRIYEKNIDEIKFVLTDKLKDLELKDFWEGKLLSDFMSHLSGVSDVIEDAGDYLNIIKISLK